MTTACKKKKVAHFPYFRKLNDHDAKKKNPGYTVIPRCFIYILATFKPTKLNEKENNYLLQNIIM